MSFLTKGISQFYKDLLHTDNSNTVLTEQQTKNLKK